MFKLFLVLFLLCFADLTNPQIITVYEGNNVDLLCIGEAGYRCGWTASYADGSSDIVAISGEPHPRDRYILTDKPQEGDCSLKIINVQKSDAAVLKCRIGSKEFATWEVVVQKGKVRPDDPYIEYNSIRLMNGEVRELDGLPAQLQCIVYEGNPDLVISWKTEKWYETNVTKDYRKVTITLTIDELPPLPSPQQIVATCVAEHELYENGRKTVSVTVGTDNLNFIQANKHVPESNQLYLECKGEPGNKCAWTKTDEHGYNEILVMSGSIYTKDRYTLIDKPQEGDCSLEINAIQTIDAGILLCRIGLKIVVQWEVIVQKIIQNTSHVEIKMKWDEPTVGDTASCEATSDFPITYRWFHKKHLELNWKKIGEDQELVLPYAGLYYCEAKSPEVWVKSSNRILIRNECI